MTIDERKECFIRKAIEKWGDLYDYSNVRYVNARTKVEIVNKENGRIFWITPDLHLRCGGGRQDEHKEYGYWNDKERCLAESKKYSCKFDFERKSYGAYHSALKNGWLDEFFKDCSNDARYNDFTEPIHCVYVYEIENLNSCYVGRTSRISIRDRQHRNGVLRHGVREYDSLHDFCEGNGIDIPTYKILSSGLTAVESQAEEERWLNEYKDRGWNVLNKGSVGIGVGSLGSVIKWTHDRCFEESRKYKSREGMKKGSPSAYNSSYRNGWLMEFFPKFAKRSDGYWNNIENCKMAASECKGMKDLLSKYGGAYNAIRRNKWQEIIKNIFKNNKKIMNHANMENNTSKPFGYWNDINHLQEEADKYNCKIDFLKGCASAYRAAQRQGILDDICKNYKKSDKSYSDLTSKIHCVYVYEIIETHSFYVGRTVNLHNRDLSHRRGRKHSDGRITYDGLYVHCETNNIDIPKPKILEENLNAKDSLINEDYWLKKYIEDGWKTLNIAKTGESSGSLGSVKIWTYDKCKEFCENYEYKSELKKANYSCYFTCLKNGWFDEFGIKDKITYWDSKDKCLNTAKECKNKKEFASKYYGAYIKSLKEGWMEDIDKIFNVDYEFEKQLCDDYKNGCTLLDLKSKYNIGLRKIIKIMSKYGMKPRNKGGFMGKKSNDIKPREGFHFVAIDKNANFETLDYLNKGGNLTTHIRNYYGVDVPSLYYRKKYRLENGREWWEQWFDIKEVKNKETKKCPFCDWKTIDVDNKSGALEMHLRREHNISRDEYLKLYYSN